MTYSSSSLPSAESASSAGYRNINKLRANRIKFLLQLRGEVLGWVGIAIAVAIAAAAAARVAVEARRQHFE
jgi:hypothetical protein